MSQSVVVSTCLAAKVGLSPDRHSGFDAIRMDVSHHRVERVEVDRLVSPFLASFVTAGEPSGRLLSDATVTWSRATPPDVDLEFGPHGARRRTDRER